MLVQGRALALRAVAFAAAESEGAEAMATAALARTLEAAEAAALLAMGRAPGAESAALRRRLTWIAACDGSPARLRAELAGRLLDPAP
jgi:hypothetical protein